MNYIYCITNLLNGKLYIGKTLLTILQRFKEHCRASLKAYGNRPLYDAMNKYGIENFKIECLEEVEDSAMLSEREIYWINELLTYGKGGYNATKGGDGTMVYDPNDFVILYNLGYSLELIALKMNCGRDTVCRILKAQGVKTRDCKKSVSQYDLAGNYIQTFSSATEAALWVLDYLSPKSKFRSSIKATICKTAKDYSKSAYGYKWKYN